MLTPVVLAGMWGLGKGMAVAAGAGAGAGYSRVENLAVDVLRLRRRAPRREAKDTRKRTLPLQVGKGGPGKGTEGDDNVCGKEHC